MRFISVKRMMVMHTHFADLGPCLITLSQRESTDGLAYVVTLDSKSDRCPKCQQITNSDIMLI